MTSEESDELTDSLTQFVMSATVTEDIDIDTTDRLVLKIYANVTGSGNDVTVTFWMEGDYNSRVALRVATSAFANLFVNKDGDTMTGDLTAPNLIATTAVQGPNVTSGVDPGHTHTYSSITSVPNHDHSGDAGDGGSFDAANLASGGAAAGYVLTADGAGGMAEAVLLTTITAEILEMADSLPA